MPCTTPFYSHRSTALNKIIIAMKSNGLAWLIYNPERQARLLARISLDPSVIATQAAERIQQASDLEREVI